MENTAPQTPIYLSSKDPPFLYFTAFSLSQPLHILNYQKTFTSQVFPQVSLRSTILHADIYTYPNTPTWQTHMVLISWKSQPCPSILDKPAPTHCYTGSIYIHTTRTATVIYSKQVRWCNSPWVCATKDDWGTLLLIQTPREKDFTLNPTYSQESEGGKWWINPYQALKCTLLLCGLR